MFRRKKTRQQRRRESRQRKPPFWTKPKIAVAGGLVVLSLTAVVTVLSYESFGGTDLTDSNIATLTAPVPSTALFVPNSAFPPKGNLIDRVRAGIYDAETYIGEMVSQTPEVMALINEGKLTGIFYDLTLEELSEKRRGIYAGKVSEQYLQVLLDHYLDPSESVKRQVAQAPFTDIATTPGSGFLTFIHIPPNAFENPRSVFRTDTDFKAMLAHEASHVNQFDEGFNYLGMEPIRLDDVVHGELNQPFAPGKIRDTFIDAISEVDAYHTELKRIVRDYLETDDAVYSDVFVGSSMNAYFRFWSRLDLAKKSELEERIWKLQQEQLVGISIKLVTDGKLRITYDFDGLRGYLEVTKSSN